MKVKVFQYGRYDAQTDNMTPVAGKWATCEKIKELDHERIGQGVEVDVCDVVDGWWVGNSAG